MEDSRIVQLYWDRSEEAIAESARSYGAYCRAIAYNVLEDAEEAEECENDTYLRAWNTIPPQRPLSLKAFLGRICRNLSLDRFRANSAKKRGEGRVYALLDELSEVIAAEGGPLEELERDHVVSVLNGFLAGLEPEKRRIFMRRYWYMDKVSDIAFRCGLSEANVKVILYRLRQQLKEVLTKEGIEI